MFQTDPQPAYEPEKQDVVVQLLHQQALAPDRIEDLQQLRRNTRSGETDGRPVIAYKRLKSRDISRRISSTSARIGRSGWFLGKRSSAAT